MLANVYYYRREANNRDTLEKYAADLPFDRLDEVQLRRGTLGFSLTGAILARCYGPRSRSRGARDSRGRVSGAQRRDQRRRLNLGCKSFANDATNLKLLALIIFGEGLHNNHHARPASAKLSAFRGEFDPSTRRGPSFGSWRTSGWPRS